MTDATIETLARSKVRFTGSKAPDDGAVYETVELLANGWIRCHNEIVGDGLDDDGVPVNTVEEGTTLYPEHRIRGITPIPEEEYDQ